MSKKLIVIPAKNEEKTIREVVINALKFGDVSVTDDASADDTPAILKDIQNSGLRKKNKNKLNIITHRTSTHIPQAIQDGMRYGISKGHDFIVTMDAGLSHDPNALPEFFNYGPAIDIVIGARERAKNTPFYRKALSRLASLIVNYSLSGSTISSASGIKDCTSGFRRYSMKAAKKIAEFNLRSKAFDFNMEALAICVRDGMSFAEIPIAYTFTNSSFNLRVLLLAVKYGLYLLLTRKKYIKKSFRPKT